MAELAYGSTVSIALDEDELLGVHLLATIEGVADEDAAGFARVLRDTLERGLTERLTAAGMQWPPTVEAIDLAESVGDEVTGTVQPETREEDGAETSDRFMLRVVMIGALALVAVVVIIGGYAFNWGWTGFSRNNQLWDWMHLLLLPVVFGTFPLWLRFSEYMSPARRRAMGVAVLAFSVLVIVGYTKPLTWTGFRGQTLWDWLTLILLPLALAGISAWPKSGRDVRTWHIVTGVLVLIGLTVTMIGGYLGDWRWTGYPGNTLWDWLLLVLAPLAVGTVVVPALAKLLTGRADERAAEEEARQAREQALRAARQRAQGNG
jgi:uncharacterized membrane protein